MLLLRFILLVNLLSAVTLRFQGFRYTKSILTPFPINTLAKLPKDIRVENHSVPYQYENLQEGISN